MVDCRVYDEVAVAMGDSLQLSSSLPSGQSLKAVQRTRRMVRWIPLAQAKDVGAHFDLTFAVEGREEGEKTGARRKGKREG